MKGERLSSNERQIWEVCTTRINLGLSCRRCTYYRQECDNFIREKNVARPCDYNIILGGQRDGIKKD